MPDDDRAVQRSGGELFTRLGLLCIDDFPQVRLLALEPGGAHRAGDHLEIDYLIPRESTCLVGEITTRANLGEVRRKYRRFLSHFNLIRQVYSRKRTAAGKEAVWQTLGVPTNRLGAFQHIRDCQGFFILTNVDRPQIHLDAAPRIRVFYRFDWKVLREYEKAIGEYASPSFLEHFQITPTRRIRRRTHVYSSQQNGLLCISQRYVTTAHSSGRCDILVFEAYPYDLLKCAKVFRRESISQDLWSAERHYQRALLPSKLERMRDLLIGHADEGRVFLFPGSILVVLSEQCHYDADRDGGRLEIPDEFGSLHIVDGQHRLFAYANNDVRTVVTDEATILITALHFPEASQDDIKRCSAQAFVEINTNQTKVRPLLLYDIAFNLLDDRTPKAISAKVLTDANRVRQRRLYGILFTNDTPTGRIRMTEITTTLAQILNPDRVAALEGATRGTQVLSREGYEALFRSPIAQLGDPDALAQRAKGVIGKYFDVVAIAFSSDWNEISAENPRSAFGLTKMFAGWIRLLKDFISEGLDWDDIAEEIQRIKRNVSSLERRRQPRLVFDMRLRSIPDAGNRQMDFYRFLSRNRRRKTSIQRVVAR